MSQIDNVKIGILRQVLSAFDDEALYGYELHKRSGISLWNIYHLLKILSKAKLIEKACDGVVSKPKRKCYALTKKGKSILSMLSIACTLENIRDKNFESA